MGADSVKKWRWPVQFLFWCPPPVLGLVAQRVVPAPLLLFMGFCPTGDYAPSLTLVPSLPTPLSRTVRGVNAIARSAAACRRGLSQNTPLHAEHLVPVTW